MLNIIRNLQYGVKNLWRWLPIIWRDRDWDWEYIAAVLEFKLRKHAELEEKFGHHAGSGRSAKEMRICAELLRRMREDNYGDNADVVFPGRGKAWCRLVISQEKQDRQYLGVLLGKYLTSWWD